MNNENMSIYCFDLDDTICIPHHAATNSLEKYGNAKSVAKVISKINRVYNDGHEVIIFTARRMLTHQGNLAKIEADVGDITRKWLSEHGVSYHKLIFGKPYADHYIDDKAMTLDDFDRLVL